MRPSRILVVMSVSVAALIAARPSSFAQTVTTLYSFTGIQGSGNPAYVVPSKGRDAKLYGTTYGPTGTSGSVFAITVAGKATQLYTLGSDGATPYAGLTLSTDGDLYGTTGFGGKSYNSGVLFNISPNGTYTVLHEFSGSDGAIPEAYPIQASDGNFYGTTIGTGGQSTIYKYTLGGSFSTIYTFDEAHGQYVTAALTEGSDGNLYGTAVNGGAHGWGTLFKLAKSGVLLWYYSFPGGTGGAFPYSALLQASDGKLYGTTVEGGVGTGCGTVFALDQEGKVSILYAFKNAADGCSPYGVMQATDGNFYGATDQGGTGGAGGAGTLYQLTTHGVHTVLYRFGVTGDHPLVPPMQDTNGTFYGTTYAGGRFGFGTVYSLNMGLSPFVAFVQPMGRIGQTAQILGQGLTGTTGVTFNGVPATNFTVITDTFLTTVVPSGATTGVVLVTTPTGQLTSNVTIRIIP